MRYLTICFSLFGLVGVADAAPAARAVMENIPTKSSVNASGFFGPLVGNVTGNIAGNATTATSASSVLQSGVNLSTVTTALALKRDLTNLTFTSSITAQALGVTYGVAGTTASFTSTATASYFAGMPYDLSGQSPSAPTASYELMKVVSNRELTLQFELSYATASVKATAVTTIDIQVNAASIGRVRWSTSNSSGTYTLTGSATVTRGDIITFIAPASPDATLAGISWNLAAKTR